ncbi:hypothetical protein MKX08_006179 [Trichoderma sp. CBMAI-0020]|nr:hypothetical protein MKX08_006179 [Trichoderma sp. CBMAI-0020]
MVCELNGHSHQPVKRNEVESSLFQRQKDHTRKIFWLCYVTDKDLALLSGLPPTLANEYCDVGGAEEYLSHDVFLLRLGEGADASNIDIISWDRAIPFLPGDPPLGVLKEKIFRLLYSPLALKIIDSELLTRIRHLDDELEGWRLSIPHEIRPKLSISQGQCLSPTVRRFGAAQDAETSPPEELHSVMHSSIDLSLEASRSTLRLLNEPIAMQKQDIFWHSIVYPLVAAMSLFVNMLMHPVGPQAAADAESLALALDIVTRMRPSADSDCELMETGQAHQLITELSKLASAAILKAGAIARTDRSPVDKDRLVTDYRLSKVDGVRASILAGNPITSFFFFFKSAYMHSQNRLLEYYFSMFENADPSCPNAVEISIIGRRSIITIDPEHIKAVLATNFAHFGKGDRFHSTWERFLGDSIFTTDGQLWQQSRTLIRPMFLKQKIRDMDIIERWSDVMISKIPPSGHTVDISDLFYRMTLDATTDYLLGHSVESLENPKGEFSKAFTYVQRKQMTLTLLAPLRRFIPKGEYNRGIKVLEAFIQPFIEATLTLIPEELQKISKSDKEFTFLHQIALFSRDPKVIRDQIMAVLLAGRDTTAATLSWALYELSNCPATWQKLRSHVLQKVGPDAAPTYEDIKDLTYLTHALYETMRLYPAVPFNIRTCLENSTLPGMPGQPGIATLKGDHVIYSTLAMQRRKELYPPVSETFADPAIFSPERWEHWTPKPWQFVPFNGGPRICIGQNFAMTEMAFMMIRLLQKYERIEYRGDWAAQYLKADIVGCPGQGVPIALYEAEKRY